MVAASGHTLGSPQLTVEIWQHIFSFVPPVFLGRLLRVNRAFQKMLTPTDSKEVLPTTAGALPYRSADSIWGATRKRFCPGLPKSVPGLNDLQMWRLLRGNNCQICGAKKPLSTTHASPDPWRSGPGADGVRVFWAFGIRSCGPCMQKATEKVMPLYSFSHGHSNPDVILGSHGSLLLHVPCILNVRSHMRLHLTGGPSCSFQ